MQLVKKSHQNNSKSPDFRQEYTSENTSRPANSSRVNLHAQKRFKRNKNDKNNNSRSSSNCSDSKTISKFYSLTYGKSQQLKFIRKFSLMKESPTPQTPIKIQQLKTPFNSYGLKNQQKLEDKKQKESNITLDVTNFLKRQFSPPVISNLQSKFKKNQKGIKHIEDSYNFLSPMAKKSTNMITTNSTKNMTKKLSPFFQDMKTCSDTKQPVQQLTKEPNRSEQLTLELQKCKNNQKKLNLLNQQLQIKAKRLIQKTTGLQHQINKSNMNNAKLKQQNHRMKVLVKQRDSLMTSFMEKDKGTIKKTVNGQNSQIRSTANGKNQSLVAKLVQYQYVNEQLKDTIQKLQKKIQSCEFNPCNSALMTPGNYSQLNGQSSEITWDDKQFADCFQEKQKQIIELREEVKNLQIEINYINRKWANEIQRAKKIQKLEFIKLKDKYKELLLKYKENMKTNFVFPPCRDLINKAQKEAQKQKNQNLNIDKPSQATKKSEINPQQLSPRRKRRNYTVDHLKGRGIMSDILINYGYGSRKANPYQQTAELQLLEYSSCQQQSGY